MKKPRPAKSSSESNSQTAKADPIPAKPLDPWTARVKAARDAYLSYLDIAEWVYAFAGAFVKREREKLEKEISEIGGETNEERWFVRSESYVPSPRISRELLQDTIRASQYLLDQGDSFARHHRRPAIDGCCLECGKELGRGKRKYCSRTCTDKYLQRRHRAKVWKGDMEKYRVSFPTPGQADAVPAPLLSPPTTKSKRKV